MIKQSTVDEIIEAGPDDYIILNDQETYTNLEGCFYLDGFGTLWDLKKLIDRLFEIHRILSPENGGDETIDCSEETMNALQVGYLDPEKNLIVRDDS